MKSKIIFDIYEELEKIALHDYTDFTLIKEDEYVCIYKFSSGNFDYVVKYFKVENLEYKIYELLSDDLSLVHMSAYTKKIVLLDDIDKISYYRFANKSDLLNKKLISKMAEWFKKLHEKGYAYNNFSLKNIVVDDQLNDFTFIDLKLVNKSDKENDFKMIKQYDEKLFNEFIEFYGGNYGR